MFRQSRLESLQAVGGEMVAAVSDNDWVRWGKQASWWRLCVSSRGLFLCGFLDRLGLGLAKRSKKKMEGKKGLT